MPNYLSYLNHVAVFDTKDGDVQEWITVRGNHIPIKKGQSKEEAVKNFIAKKSDKESSVRSNKPESVGTAVNRVVKQTEENRKTYKEATNTRKLENGGGHNDTDPRPKNADAETINDVLFDKYVPNQGKADTLLGEQLRAINKIVYRYENDGDMYGNGYGVETVNAPIKFLQSLYEEKSIPGLSGILRSLKNAAQYNDTTEYEHNIQRLKNIMVEADWGTLKKLASIKNDEDMYSFEDNTRYDDDDDEEW